MADGSEEAWPAGQEAEVAPASAVAAEAEAVAGGVEGLALQAEKKEEESHEKKRAGEEDWQCPICLNDIPFVNTARVQGCGHLFCSNCILNWVLFKRENASNLGQAQATGTYAAYASSSPRKGDWEAQVPCPTCRHPFNTLCTYRHLDGTLSETLVEENICLLLRADWFDNDKFAKYRKGKCQQIPHHSHSHTHQPHYEDYLAMSPGTRKLYGADDYDEAAFDNACYDFDHDDECCYDEYDEYDHPRHFSGGGAGVHGGASSSGSAKLVIGNRRWGAHGYVNSGRMYARPSGSGSSSGTATGKGKGKGKAAAAAVQSSKNSKGKGKVGGKTYDDFDDGYGFGDDDYKPRYDSTLQGKHQKKSGGMGRRAKRALKNKGAAKNGLDRAVC